VTAPPPTRRPRLSRRSGAIALFVVVVAALGFAMTRIDADRSSASRPQNSSPQVGSSSTAADQTSVSSTTAPRDLGNPITFTAVGDTELGKAGQLPPDPDTYLEGVKAAMAAPIVFGNLEGTLTDATGSKCGPGSTACFAFRVPPSYAAVMRRAGFTVLNSANNHSHDYGDQGVADTKAALAAAGIAQTGLVGQIATVVDGTTKVAFVGFAPYNNTNSMLDLASAARLIGVASQEADVVVVYMHDGAEGADASHVTGREESYVGEDRGNAQVFARAAVDAGADAVIGSGPHVLRGIEWYHGHLIVYSLGNFANFHNFQAAPSQGQSAILRMSLDANGQWVNGSITSVLLNAEGRPAIDSSGGAARTMNALSAADFGPAGATISPIAATGQISSPPPGT
jgi:hypothetical protein